MLQTTRIGKAMRAVADNRDLAESSGIDVDRVILFVWIARRRAGGGRRDPVRARPSRSTTSWASGCCC